MKTETNLNTELLYDYEAYFRIKQNGKDFAWSPGRVHFEECKARTDEDAVSLFQSFEKALVGEEKDSTKRVELQVFRKIPEKDWKTYPTREEIEGDPYDNLEFKGQISYQEFRGMIPVSGGAAYQAFAQNAQEALKQMRYFKRPLKSQHNFKFNLFVSVYNSR